MKTSHTTIKRDEMEKLCANRGFRYAGRNSNGPNWHTVVHERTNRAFRLHVWRDKLPTLLLKVVDMLRRGTAPRDGVLEAM